MQALTKAQKQYVMDGCIHGDCTMRTVRALKNKGMFHLVISSPSGTAGFMELTDAGKAMQKALREKAARQ